MDLDNRRPRKRRSGHPGRSPVPLKAAPKVVSFNLPPFLLLWSATLFLHTSYFLFVWQPSTPSLSTEHSVTVRPPALALNALSIEIFSAPYPFHDNEVHTNRTLDAIRSWYKLTPTPTVTLLGKHMEPFQQHFPDIQINPTVDTTFLGVPLFNSIFHTVNSSRADITVLINSDILLFPDFFDTLGKVHSAFADYLIVAARYDVADVDDMDKHGTLHTYGGMDVWAWNTNGTRLFNPTMPNFIFGRAKYDNWFTHEVIAARRRTVIDVTETCTLVHQRHVYASLASATNSKSSSNVKQDTVTPSEKKVDFHWSKDKTSNFELFINIHLSINSGTFKNQLGSILYAPWKTARCMQGDGICIIKRLRPGICACEHSTFAYRTQTDPLLLNDSMRTLQCGLVTYDEPKRYRIPVSAPRPDEIANRKKKVKWGLPLTLDGLLSKQKDEQNTVILAGVNWGYRDFLMNWVCNMRKLNITNFIVAAFDAKVYKFGFLRGLPIYYEDTVSSSALGVHTADSSESGLDDDSDDDGMVEYGSDAFKELTKMKSRTVLRLLRRGVHVLWSDVDIIFFRNPLQTLRTKYTGEIIIQSNAPDGEDAVGKRRLNSGFYLVYATNRTVDAFRAIKRYARRSKMSEQPCFYDVLCGKDGGTVVPGVGCKWDGRVMATVLDRSEFANGKTGGMWESGRIGENVEILHNNWAPVADKQERLRQLGLNFYDGDLRVCRYNH